MGDHAIRTQNEDMMCENMGIGMRCMRLIITNSGEDQVPIQVRSVTMMAKGIRAWAQMLA